MILSVPFAFDVIGYEPRRRNPSQDRRRAVLDVWVEEIPAEDAPVAAVWNRKGGDHGRPRISVDLRHHAGGLWVRSEDSKDTPRPGDGPYPAGDAVAAGVRDGRREGNPFAGFLSQMPEPGRAEMMFGRECRSGRESVEAAIRARAAEIVAIDGILHLRCPEPVYVRQDYGYRSASEMLSTEWYEPGARGRSAPGGVYRVDEWDRVRADAMRDHAGHPGKFDLPETGEFEVLIPEAFEIPAEGMALSECAFKLWLDLGQRVTSSVQSGARSRNRSSDDGHGRDVEAWRKPFDIEMPKPAALEAWAALGTVLQSGFDDSAVEILRGVAGADLAATGVHRRHDSVADGLVALADAIERWDGRPARFVEEATPEDVAAFAGVGALP